VTNIRFFAVVAWMAILDAFGAPAALVFLAPTALVAYSLWESWAPHRPGGSTEPDGDPVGDPVGHDDGRPAGDSNWQPARPRTRAS
jgi:hypothetical protein